MVKMCVAPNCERPVGEKGARGHCPKHYRRLMRGIPLDPHPVGTPEQRFNDRHQRGGPDDCWPWTGGADKDGYGLLWVGKANVRAHRFSWESASGEPVPDGLWVLHRCDNPPCVNPAHLYVGSPEDNNRDRIVRGRFRGNPDPWACKRRLTAEQVEEIRAFGNPHRHARSELAKRYGVTYQHIMAIQRGQRR